VRLRDRRETGRESEKAKERITQREKETIERLEQREREREKGIEGEGK